MRCLPLVTVIIIVNGNTQSPIPPYDREAVTLNSDRGIVIADEEKLLKTTKCLPSWQQLLHTASEWI